MSDAYDTERFGFSQPSSSNLIPPLGRPPSREGAKRTMSSMEIASLTGKRHDHVVRDIKVMLVGLYGSKGQSFDAVAGDAPNLDHRGKTVAWTRDTRGYINAFHLDEDHSYTLVTGYDVRLRAAVIGQWQELKARAAAPPAAPVLAINVRDHGQLTAIALQLIEVNRELEARAVGAEAHAAELEPKALAHDRIAELRGTFTRTAAAKILGVPPNVLMTWMANNGWTYTRTGGTDVLAHQAKLNAGLLENKIAEGRDGATWRKINVHVTPKGLTVLAKAFPPLLQIAGAA